MGFADKFVRFIRNEPLYQPGDVSSEEQQQNAAVTPGSQPQGVVPVVRIMKAKNVAMSGGLQVRATLQNDSGDTLQLHEIEMLGQTIRLELIIMPKEVKQDVIVYSGPALTNSNVGMAVLRYRTQQQDTVFNAVYMLVARMVDEGLLGITDFNLQLPVRTV